MPWGPLDRSATEGQVRRAFTILGLALGLVGCISLPSADSFELAHSKKPADGRLGECSLGWWTAGKLVVGPSGGTAINVEGGDFAEVGDTMPVEWWPKYSGRRVGKEVEVLDPDGNVVATTGRRYRIESAFPMDAGFVVCGHDVTPLPTAADLAAAYLAADRELDQANKQAIEAFNETSRNLAAGKKLHGALAKNEQAFIDEFVAKTWLGDSAPVASRLFRCHSALSELEKSAGRATSVREYDKYKAKAEDRSAACSGIANELRMTLDLPEVSVSTRPVVKPLASP